MSKLKVLPNDSGGLSPGGYYRSTEAIVDISNEEDVNKWASNLDISPKELKAAVAIYGCVIKDIRRGLIREKNAA